MKQNTIPGIRKRITVRSGDDPTTLYVQTLDANEDGQVPFRVRNADGETVGLLYSHTNSLVLKPGAVRISRNVKGRPFFRVADAPLSINYDYPSVTAALRALLAMEGR